MKRPGNSVPTESRENHGLRRTRERILSAGVEVFGADGYRGGSLRKVAEKAGLTLPGLLHQFSSKEELLRALLERRDEVLAIENAAEFANLDLVDRLVFVARRNMSNPGMARLFIILAAESTDPSHAAHSFFRQRYERVEREFRETMIEQQSGRILRSDLDIEVQVRTIIAISDGLQLRWLLHQDFDLADAMAAALAHLREGQPSEPEKCNCTADTNRNTPGRISSRDYPAGKPSRPTSRHP